jgi:hypothetical protein
MRCSAIHNDPGYYAAQTKGTVLFNAGVITLLTLKQDNKKQQQQRQMKALTACYLSYEKGSSDNDKLKEDICRWHLNS